MPAFIPQSPAGGFLNPHLSADLDAYAGIIGQPPLATHATPRAMLAARTLAPVSAHAPARAGFMARSFTDDFYHRIHISPREVALGNVASVQSFNVQIWNAHLEDQTLLSVSGDEQGIEITAPGPVPMLFRALQELTWSISVTSDGPSNVDTDIAWLFAGLDAVAVHITASRIIAWPFVPDWSEGVTEWLRWATDILASETGVEQRRALRIAPRRGFDAAFLFSERERVLAELMIMAWGARIWALPIWPDLQFLAADLPAGSLSVPCTTAGFDFVDGGLAMLRGESAMAYEVVQVAAVAGAALNLGFATQRDWPAGTRLYPVRRAEFETQPDLRRVTDQFSSGEIGFRMAEPCDWPEAAPATRYRGWPVIELPPEESEDLTRSFARLLTELDNGTSLPVRTDTAKRGLCVQGYRWQPAGREEHSALRGLLYWLRGRQRAAWLPTFADDLQMVATAGAGAATMDVAFCGYTQFGRLMMGRQDIRIELASGTALHRRIIGASVIDDDTERLLLDAPWAETLQPADINRISFMALSRGDSDDIEMLHITDADGLARVQQIFRSVRDEL